MLTVDNDPWSTQPFLYLTNSMIQTFFVGSEFRENEMNYRVLPQIKSIGSIPTTIKIPPELQFEIYEQSPLFSIQHDGIVQIENQMAAQLQMSQ